MGKYWDEAKREARKIFHYLSDEIVAEIMEEKGPIEKVRIADFPSGDQYAPGDDQNYSLIEAAKSIEELNQFEETDSAYWEGQDIRRAFRTVASLTYRNAVNYFFTGMIDVLNDAIGNMDISWTLEQRLLEERGQQEKGVLEWSPREPLPADKLERLEKRHQTRLLQEIQIMVSRARSV